MANQNQSQDRTQASGKPNARNNAADLGNSTNSAPQPKASTGSGVNDPASSAKGAYGAPKTSYTDTHNAGKSHLKEASGQTADVRSNEQTRKDQGKDVDSAGAGRGNGVAASARPDTADRGTQRGSDGKSAARTGDESWDKDFSGKDKSRNNQIGADDSDQSDDYIGGTGTR